MPLRFQGMAVMNYLDHAPALGSDVVVAESAVIVGKVSIAGPCVIEDRAVLRGDQNRVQLGPRCRFGRGSSAHVELPTPTILGADVWVGDDAVVHACTLGDGVRVEDGGLVLSNSSVGEGSIIAADALVPEGVSFPANSYIEGTPGRRVRDTTPEERAETLARIKNALQ
jgi:carbonic anhydrase/acetyltransferase-like protein (isoleucine patch superfamily)